MGKVKNIPETAEELRAFLVDKIRSIDDKEELIRLAEHLQEEEKKQTVVGYRPGGRPITLSEMEQGIQKSDEEFEKGEYFTLEEVEKKFGL